jgi:hypothetical protein
LLFAAAMSRKQKSIVIPALLFLCAACDDHSTDWRFEGQVSRSSFWEYHDSFDEPLCPTLLEMLDEHTRVVGGKIGLEVEESRPLRYYRFKDEAGVASGCPAEVAACAAGDSVLAQEPFYAHEQAHTYVSRAWGDRSIGLMKEGEAVALSCDPFSRPYSGISPRDALGAEDWRQFLYLFGNSESGYAAAGYWITYLARQYGWQKVGELHRRALPGISADDFAIEFARTFPISMDQAWTEALNGDSPPCDNRWRCRTTDLVPGEVAQPDCDGELHRSIEISGESGVVLTHRRSIYLQDCSDAASPVYELVPGRLRTTSWASLPTGRYALFGGDAAPSDVTFASYLPSPFVAEDCELAGKITLPPDQYTIVHLSPGPIDGCLRLDGAGQRYTLGFLNVEFSEAGSAAVCESSDPGAACLPVPARASTTLTVGAGAVMHLRGAEATPSTSRPWGEIMFYPAPSVDGGT